MTTIEAVALDVTPLSGTIGAVTESFFTPVDGVIVAPAGEGREAFVHVGDIAEVAAATLLDPATHAGAGYTLTGPEALTFAEVAEHLAAATGQPVEHVDADPETWEQGLVEAGLPADYAGLLGGLLAVLRGSGGAEVTDDVERLTGHAPRGIVDLADELAVARTR